MTPEEIQNLTPEARSEYLLQKTVRVVELLASYADRNASASEAYTELGAAFIVACRAAKLTNVEILMMLPGLINVGDAIHAAFVHPLN